MDLTFQVPMQYCSSQHWTLLLSPVTPTTVYCFYFGSILSFFLEYFSTDVQYHIGHLPTWEVHFSLYSLFAFSYCSWGSQGKNTEVVCDSLLRWTTFCQRSENAGKWVQFLGCEIPLEKEMKTHCSILAWRIPLTEEYDRLQCVG